MRLKLADLGVLELPSAPVPLRATQLGWRSFTAPEVKGRKVLEQLAAKKGRKKAVKACFQGPFLMATRCRTARSWAICVSHECFTRLKWWFSKEEPGDPAQPAPLGPELMFFVLCCSCFWAFF